MPSFRNFSSNSIKVILLAQEESRRLGHNYVVAEQLLIGLLSSNNGASQLLRKAGVNLETAKAQVETIIGRGAGFISKEMPFTSRAKRVLERAIAVADE